MIYITGTQLKTLREDMNLTQKELADILDVSDKTISKWETSRGYPDISILPELAKALGVSVSELLTNNIVRNNNRHGNMLKTEFYVCPVCSNVIHSIGEGLFHCCGISLPKLEAEADCGDIKVQNIDGELFVSLVHEMNKQHYISFIAYATADTLNIKKCYPEQNAECYFAKSGSGIIYVYCNRHGLIKVNI